MALLDNLRSTERRRSLKHYIIIGLLISLIGLLWLIGSSKKPADNNVPKSNEYYDRRSGQTVSDPAGKTPDRFGGEVGTPIFLGISRLLDYGITIGQLNAIKQAFFDYSKSTNANIKEVSIEVSSVKSLPFESEDANIKQSLAFNVQFDRDKVYNARVDYFGIDSVQLYIRGSSNQIIYDSGRLEPLADTTEYEEVP